MSSSPPSAPPASSPARAAHLPKESDRATSLLDALVRNPLRAAEAKMGGWRTAAALLGLVAAVMAARPSAPSHWSWLAITSGLVFFVLLFLHQKLRAKLRRADLRAALYARGRELRQLRVPANLKSQSWAHELESSAEWRDLDLGGEQGVFRSLAFPLSTGGLQRLGWRLAGGSATSAAPAQSAEELRVRRQQVRELERRHLLRRRFLQLSLRMAEERGGHFDSEELRQQLASPIAKSGSPAVLIAIALAQVGIWLCALMQIKIGFTIFGTLTLALYAVAATRVQFLTAYGQALSLARSLGALMEVTRLAQAIRQSGALELSKVLSGFWGETSPEQELKKIERAAGALGLRQNFILHILVHLFLPWDLFWSIRLERARERIQGEVAKWMAGLEELEATAPLAEFGALNRDYVEPEFVDSSDAQIEAIALSHPRLARERRVGNDLYMHRDLHRRSQAGACHLITGSNMAGKSTFLRTVGLNVMLARAGARVPAQRMRLSPVWVETSLRPGDSLDDGFSSFYAEVRELRAMLSRAQERKLTLYLIDEIFRGTNNRERRQGAEAYIRAIAATSAIGAVTTHDLDLASLESQVPGLKNFHFKDEVVDGRMQFSYRKEHGPCPSTNALRVMQLEGLPV
jgi:hypothetical protein